MTATRRPSASSSRWAPAPRWCARRRSGSPPTARRSARCRSSSTGRSRSRISSPRCRQAFEAVAVLDRCKEPGGTGEPLYQDVVTALAQAVASGERATMPRVFGGRYGLSSKDFHPGMVKAVFDEAAKPEPRNGFTIGIDDDVSGTSLATTAISTSSRRRPRRALFFGLGSDGTVGANKNSVKMLAEDADRFAQGYFVYDSHKSGAETVSHLRFGREPIHAPYLIRHADFVACHRFEFLRKLDILGAGAAGRRPSCSTRPTPPRRSGTRCPGRSSATSSRSSSASSSSTRPRWRRTSASGRGSTRSCRPASSPSPRSCRATRRSPRSRRRSRRPMAARAARSSRRTSPRSTRRWRISTR